MTTTNTDDHLAALPETVPSEPASGPSALEATGQPQAANVAVTTVAVDADPIDAPTESTVVSEKTETSLSLPPTEPTTVEAAKTVVVAETPPAPQPQPPVTKVEEDDDDLEEGELKDDDDDSDDDDEVDGATPMTIQQPARLLPVSNAGSQYNVMQLDPRLASGQAPSPLGPDGEQGSKKKKKKRVVRKKVVKVKVIKKVPKKKADQQQQSAAQSVLQGQQQRPLLPQQPMLPQNQTSQQQHQQQQQPQPFDNLNIVGTQRLLPHIQSNNSNLDNNANSSPVTQAQPAPLLPTASQQPTGNNLDSLLEQQILMLQELQRQQHQQPLFQHQQPMLQQQQFNHADQQHAQILRAAATDEDLRYMQPPYLFNAQPMNLMQQQQPPDQHHIQPFISQSNPLTQMSQLPFTTSTMPNITLAPPGMMTSTPSLMNSMANNSMLGRPNAVQQPGILPQNDGLTPMMQQQLHLISQQNQSLVQQQATVQSHLPQSQLQSHLQYPNQQALAPLGLQQNHQVQRQQQQQQQQQQEQQQLDTTPSSPDDENGKSSYEAISKMLTLLRNSANVSESSETNNQSEGNNPTGDSDLTEANQTKNEVEYSLIPVLVQGIDYTKYKLLSQYEPKFKNDPRLNQQA